MFDNAKICSACGGRCCKGMPGSYWPEQFGNDKRNIATMIESGTVTIDWWEGEREGGGKYYLRPKTEGEENTLFHGSWGGQCVLFVEGKGCPLSPDDRPMGCQLCEPKDDFKCVSHAISGSEKSEAVSKWAHLSDFLESFRRAYD